LVFFYSASHDDVLNVRRAWEDGKILGICVFRNPIFSIEGFLYNPFMLLHHSNQQSPSISTPHIHLNKASQTNTQRPIANFDMKPTAITSTVAILASSLAIPTDIIYGPPAGGWGSIDYPSGPGENLLVLHSPIQLVMIARELVCVV
jgi:hypothetical protein